MIEITSFIENGVARVIGITGGAGSGKTTLCEKLNYPTYHIDSDFIGDSKYRKELLATKKERSEEAWIDIQQQYNWWNWEEVEHEIKLMMLIHDKFLVEGAIFGPPAVVNLLDVIILLEVSPKTRFDRLFNRDSHKRSLTELINRFDITSRSEHEYYRFLIENYYNKIRMVNEEYRFI